jgi:riboflavin biosynthesis pyrimidine reductase
MRRLSHDAGEIDVDTLIFELSLGARAPADRPYTLVNFVSSADGRATLEGVSGGLGDDGDRQIFRALRRAVDAVLAGTGTLAGENYGRLIKDPAARRAREQRGLAPEPIATTVTRSGRLPTQIPLFAEPEARIVAFSGGPVALGDARARVDVVTMAPEQLTFAAALRTLREPAAVRGRPVGVRGAAARTARRRDVPHPGAEAGAR